MASPWLWIKNTLRNKLRSHAAGRLLAGEPAPIARLHIVSATRMDEKQFWKSSALGLGLAALREDPRLAIHVAFENKSGLPAVYNAALRQAGDHDAVLFIHDDIWLDDPRWLEKLLEALARFDVVGVAGNRRRVKRQPAWLFTELVNDKFSLDMPNLSGWVAHGKQPKGEVTWFGESPAHCELIDGLFIAARCDALKPAGVEFDEHFQFHFYDLDFCRTARAAGLSIGTWPIELTHQSVGSFRTNAWKEGLARYFGKWET
jgi:glycosyltransferase involved in cell wall biosynthesis